MRCAEPRSNSSSTRIAMAICSHPATIMAPHRTPFLLLAAVLIPTIVCAADYAGRVVGVIDGDTTDVLNSHHVERICLIGIDCPEKGQMHGMQAKQTAQNWPTGRKSRFSPSARTSTDIPLLKCSWPMDLTLTTHSAKTAGAGCIGSINRI
jgi:endonuclease YncB( thermonuclease family)